MQGVVKLIRSCGIVQSIRDSRRMLRLNYKSHVAKMLPLVKIKSASSSTTQERGRPYRPSMMSAANFSA